MLHSLLQILVGQPLSGAFFTPLLFFLMPYLTRRYFLRTCSVFSNNNFLFVPLALHHNILHLFLLHYYWLRLIISFFHHKYYNLTSPLVHHVFSIHLLFLSKSFLSRLFAYGFHSAPLLSVATHAMTPLSQQVTLLPRVIFLSSTNTHSQRRVRS